MSETLVAVVNGYPYTQEKSSQWSYEGELVADHFAPFLYTIATLQTALTLATQQKETAEAKAAETQRYHEARGRDLKRLLSDAEAERDALRRVVSGVRRKALAEVDRAIVEGERYSYSTGSEPMGVRGGVHASVKGDLCDLRHRMLIAIDAALAVQPTTGVTDSAPRVRGHITTERRSEHPSAVWPKHEADAVFDALREQP